MPSLYLNEEDRDIRCPLDNGEAVLLGQLGCLTWFRCRSCGIEFNHEES